MTLASAGGNFAGDATPAKLLSGNTIGADVSPESRRRPSAFCFLFPLKCLQSAASVTGRWSTLVPPDARWATDQRDDVWHHLMFELGLKKKSPRASVLVETLKSMESAANFISRSGDTCRRPCYLCQTLKRVILLSGAPGLKHILVKI